MLSCGCFKEEGEDVMELYLSILVDELHEFKQDIAFEAVNDMPLKNVRVLSKEFTSLGDRNQDLFLTTSDYLKVVSKKEILPQNMIVLGVLPEKHMELSEKNILYLETDTSEGTLFYQLQDIFSAYHEWQNEILCAIIKDKGVNLVLDIAAQKLHNPVALFDGSSSLIHWAGEILQDSTNTIWEDVFSKGYSMDFYSMSEWKKLAVQINNSNDPFLYEAQKSQIHLACPVKMNGKLVASLGMTALNRPITNGQMRIVSFVQKMLELVYFNSNIQRRTDEENSYYLECLLNNIFIEDKVIHHYLSQRGWKVQDTYLVLLLACPITFDMATVTKPYIDRIQRKFPYGLLCVHENSIIVIINITKEQYEQEKVEQKLTALFDKYQIQSGLSTEFYSFTDLRYYYIQCKSALQCGKKRKPDQAFFYALDYYEDIITDSLAASINLKSLCHPRLLELWRKKGAGKDSLIETLYSYLNSGRSIVKTAAALHIHRNTLNYRLDKISDLLSIPLEELSPEIIFFLLISCKILQKME